VLSYGLRREAAATASRRMALDRRAPYNRPTRKAGQEKQVTTVAASSGNNG